MLCVYKPLSTLGGNLKDYGLGVGVRLGLGLGLSLSFSGYIYIYILFFFHPAQFYSSNLAILLGHM